MASGLLSLKWNNHRTTFFHVLSTVRSKEAYCDVTLACDGKFYPVHKLVLSTCSDYFERMFERTNCKHPIIVLKDIRHDELEALLNYMYVGEVNVLQNELAGLIKAAECLMIKGLAVPDEAPVKDSKRSSFNREDSPHAKRRKRDDDGRSSLHNQHLQREGSSQRQSSSASMPTPSSRIAPPSPSASVGSASDTLSEDISQSQSENNNAQEHPKRPGKEQTSSQSQEVPEVIIDEAGVKEEPTDVEEEVTETKEMLDPEFSFDPLPEGDSRSDPGGGSGGYDSQVLSSQPQSMEDLVAQAIPGSSGLQGNSLWEGDGSLQGFPMEGYSGDGSRPPQMVAKKDHGVQCCFKCARCKKENKVGEKDFLSDVAPDDLNYYFRCHFCGFLSMVTKHSWQNLKRIKQDPTSPPLGKRVQNFQAEKITLAPRSFADHLMQVLSFSKFYMIERCQCNYLESVNPEPENTDSESLVMNEVSLEIGLPEENAIKLEEPLSPFSREPVKEEAQVNCTCLESFTLQDIQISERHHESENQETGKCLCSTEETRCHQSTATHSESMMLNQVKPKSGLTDKNVMLKLEEPVSPFSGEVIKEEPQANDIPLECVKMETPLPAHNFEGDDLYPSSDDVSSRLGVSSANSNISFLTEAKDCSDIREHLSPSSSCKYSISKSSQESNKQKIYSCRKQIPSDPYGLEDSDDSSVSSAVNVKVGVFSSKNEKEDGEKINVFPACMNHGSGDEYASQQSSSKNCHIALAKREHNLETGCGVDFKNNYCLDNVRNDIEFIRHALKRNSEPKLKCSARRCKPSSVYPGNKEACLFQNLSETFPANISKLSVDLPSERQTVVIQSSSGNAPARNLISQASQNTVTKDTSVSKKLSGNVDMGTIMPNGDQSSKKGHDISSSLKELFQLASEYRSEDTVSQDSEPIYQDMNVPSTSGKRSFSPTSPGHDAVESKVVGKYGSDKVYNKEDQQKTNMDLVALQHNMSQLSPSKSFSPGLVTSTPLQCEGKKKRIPKTKPNKLGKLSKASLPAEHNVEKRSCMQSKNNMVSSLDSEVKTSVEGQHCQGLVSSTYYVVGTNASFTSFNPFSYLQSNFTPGQKRFTPILPKTTEGIDQPVLLFNISPNGGATGTTESSSSAKAEFINEISPGKLGTNAAGSSCGDLPAKPRKAEVKVTALDNADANFESTNATVMETNTPKDCPSSSPSGKRPCTKASPVRSPMTREAVKISKIVSAKSRGKIVLRGNKSLKMATSALKK